jgi:hypothetical protein
MGKKTLETSIELKQGKEMQVHGVCHRQRKVIKIIHQL